MHLKTQMIAVTRYIFFLQRDSITKDLLTTNNVILIVCFIHLIDVITLIVAIALSSNSIIVNAVKIKMACFFLTLVLNNFLARSIY